MELKDTGTYSEDPRRICLLGILELLPWQTDEAHGGRPADQYRIGHFRGVSWISSDRTSILAEADAVSVPVAVIRPANTK